MSNEPKKSMELALYSQATDVAGLCKEIVVKTAIEIQGRKFVPVEAWTTIAVAHGCIATIKSVEVMEDGIKAVAEIRRQSDGVILTTAEGFVGRDEPVWFGGVGTRWNRAKRCEEEHIYVKRPDYAIRAMAQTRAVSRACRTAFSHVVVLMNAGLSTTPYEEAGGDDEERHRGDAAGTGEIDKGQEKNRERAEVDQTKKPAEPPEGAPGGKAIEVKRDVDPGLRERFRDGQWENVGIHFGANSKGKTLGELTDKALAWWINDWQPKPFNGKPISDQDAQLRAALDVAAEELKD